MPFVQVHTSRDLSASVRRRFGAALAALYAETMQTDRRIVNVGFVRYAPGDLARYDGAGDDPQEMTVVTCDVRAGREAERHERLGRAIAAACAEAIGIAEARVAVYVTEHAATEIYRDGGRAPDWSPAEGVGTAAAGNDRIMNAAAFDERVDAVDRRIRETEPGIAGEIALERAPGEAQWRRSHYVATLILHDAERFPRLSLQLATGGEQHPAPLQIGFDDADAVNLIAVPAAELLAGRPSDGR